MSSKPNFILKLLNVISWIAFIGLCIKAGTLIVSYGVSMFIDEVGAKNLQLGLDLSHLKAYDVIDYSIMVFCLTVITIFEALVFYCVIQIFLKINFISPFHETIGKLIEKMSIFAFFAGILSNITSEYSAKFTTLGVQLPNLTEHIGLGSALLFFAGILYFISQLFAKGIELQKENDLTI
ncbi:DUF2975 domain-containing protein [Flavobacterium endoglycinae]|uniref:DUF2975 domain-containing protein n=1 Tax=Flavobacterium endoglycinae TaxID=2816357 RepID=A0ABX7QCH9_9FLAO|nr:DUF2975 domain-containing protein [Flavobacterium endoglycinae]QSW88121.1 DUF2975 domain-containing protein [Flavobacterium endoglycinae]